MTTFSAEYVAWCVEHDLFRNPWYIGDWLIDVDNLCMDPDKVPPPLTVPAIEVLRYAKPRLFAGVHQLAGVGPGPRRVWLPTADDWIEMLSAKHNRQGSFRDANARESIVLADIFDSVAHQAKARYVDDPLLAFARVWEVWSR